MLHRVSQIFFSFITSNVFFTEDLKKVYLKLYNLFQFIGYTYVLMVMAVRYAKLDYDSVADTYEHVGPAMKFLQLLQYLEVMHPLFGYTRVSGNAVLWRAGFEIVSVILYYNPPAICQCSKEIEFWVPNCLPLDKTW